MDNPTKLMQDFDHMIARAQRNHQLFGSVAWQAHLETITDDQLPELLQQKELVEANMVIFAAEADEMSRLEDCLEMVTRSIAHIQARKQKKGKR